MSSCISVFSDFWVQLSEGMVLADLQAGKTATAAEAAAAEAAVPPLHPGSKLQATTPSAIKRLSVDKPSDLKPPAVKPSSLTSDSVGQVAASPAADARPQALVEHHSPRQMVHLEDVDIEDDAAIETAVPQPEIADLSKAAAGPAGAAPTAPALLKAAETAKTDKEAAAGMSFKAAAPSTGAEPDAAKTSAADTWKAATPAAAPPADAPAALKTAAKADAGKGPAAVADGSAANASVAEAATPTVPAADQGSASASTRTAHICHNASNIASSIFCCLL